LSPLKFSIFINSLGRIPINSRFLCFADDIKLFMEIKSINDCLKLQSDIDRFVELFGKLGLSLNSLNISKCTVITFPNLTLNPLIFSYHLPYLVILRCDEFVMDLDFKLSSNLDPSRNIDFL